MIHARTILLGINFFCQICVFGVACAAQEVYSQKDKEDFSKSFYKGCLDKQARDNSTAYLLPSVVEESCKCLSDKVTANVFGSIEFQLAASRKDIEAAKHIILQATESEGLTRSLMACLKASIDRHGGQSKILREGQTRPLSRRIGLTGNSRIAYVSSGVQACQETQRKIPSNKNISDKLIDTFCKCAMDFSADRISQANVVEILEQQPSGIKLQEKLGEAAGNYCRKKIFGINDK